MMISATWLALVWLGLAYFFIILLFFRLAVGAAIVEEMRAAVFQQTQFR